MRSFIAGQCNRAYGMNLRPEDVTDCDGCTASHGRLFSGCMTCRIRTCAMSKNISTCAFCEDYACDILNQHFKLDPQARTRLEEIRRSNN